MSTKHPIQPLEKDAHGTLRFKENKIVSHVLKCAEKHGGNLNDIAVMDFTNEDRQQFAQLIGYSLSGYSELLSYVDDAAYMAAEEMRANPKLKSDAARIKTLERELARIRKQLRNPMAELFGCHPDDLKNNG